MIFVTVTITTLNFMQEQEPTLYSWKNIKGEDRRTSIQSANYVEKKKRIWSTL